MRSKFLSDKPPLSGVKILPATLNNRSTEADEGNAALFFIKMALMVGYLFRLLSFVDWSARNILTSLDSIADTVAVKIDLKKSFLVFFLCGL
jgi:hypothetical protein